MPQLSYFKVTGVWEPSSPKGVINGDVTFTMLIQNNGVLAAPTLDNPAVVVPTVVHTVIDNNTLQPVSLLANTAALNLTGTLYYTAEFSNVSYREPGQPEAGLTIGPITFAASTDATAVNLVNVTPAAGVVAVQLASVDNADGTLSVNGVKALEPLSTVAIVTTSASPAIGQSTWYNATSGNLTPPLPALSGLRVGARLAVRRDPADVSQNTVTLTCAGSDTFYSSGGTTATLPMSGEQREYQVISVAGTKYYAPAGSLNPVAALDQRYLAGASKLVSIGDAGFGSTTAAVATSTVGTSEMAFTVGVAATSISALFNHWYTGTYPDTDPSGPISFNASVKVVSSTNPGTTAGTIYRLTFNGRTTATLDPGGRIVADPVGVSLLPGDVVEIRTYLSSGTAYAPCFTYGGPYGGIGGFSSAGDLTAPGSAAITSSGGYYFGPAALLGRAAGANTAKSIALFGDSIGIGRGDGTYITKPATPQNGFAYRALTGNAGLLNMAIAGDSINGVGGFLTTGGSFRRLSNAERCNSAIIQYGTNDLQSPMPATTLEGWILRLASELKPLGIGKVFVTTLVPRTTSTDGWATTANQTPLSTEAQRVSYNTWVRAGCPINATTLAAVAIGTAGALTAGQTGHPVTAIFDTAVTVESSLNSGLWLPCNRVTTGSISSGSLTLTASGASFVSANQESGGDKGSAVMVLGAGTSGANLQAYISAVTSSTQTTLSPAAGTTVSSAQVNIGIATIDGVHPSPHSHYLMSQAINPAML